MEERITKVWFEDGRIFINTDKGQVYSRPLEAFPLLKDATESQKKRFEIGMFADEIHWTDIDEDIALESFLIDQEANYDNDTAKIFKQHPNADISDVAKRVGIHKTLLQKYIYGINKPSQERFDNIVRAISTTYKTV
jgi:hypothetical protein